MNGDFALTDYLDHVQRTICDVLQPGHAVTFGEAALIAGQINTTLALARELEEENRILDHRLRASRDNLRNRKAAADITDVATKSNVTAFRPLTSPKKGL